MNTMKPLITNRQIALDSNPLSIERKVCSAASDYFQAISRPDFAKEVGVSENLTPQQLIKALHDDMEVFVHRWEQSL